MEHVDDKSKNINKTIKYITMDTTMAGTLT
jgi:hypothetical protein